MTSSPEALLNTPVTISALTNDSDTLTGKFSSINNDATPNNPRDDLVLYAPPKNFGSKTISYRVTGQDGRIVKRRRKVDPGKQAHKEDNQ